MLNTNKEILHKVLNDRGVSESKILDVIDSGYIVHNVGGSDCIIDSMYGLKMHSSCFDIDKFCQYLKGDCNPFTQYDFSHCSYIVKNIDEIKEILADFRRQHYIKEGTLSFRGQTKEYSFKRKVPNPVRGNSEGREISIFPGVFRQNPNDFYSFNHPFQEQRTLAPFINQLEPNPLHNNYYSHSYDSMRVEQHYATQTSGLDISFDIETAIFFATYNFNYNENNVAHHIKVKKGEHQGVIYGFKFTNPPVKKTQYYIDQFDFFNTYIPERILRQDCGLPLIGDCERNIAITDIDFVIYLHEDFNYEGIKTSEYMFPNREEDKFYDKLIELKKQHPELLSNIVEYGTAKTITEF